MTKNVEIFKALRIITIMLFFAKTNKTVCTDCSFSPFTTTETSKKNTIKKENNQFVNIRLAPPESTPNSCLFLLFPSQISAIQSPRLS